MTGAEKRRLFDLAAVITIFAFFLRLCAAAFYENDYDTAWNLQWAHDIQDGFFNAYDGHVWNLDYPPLYLYVLKIVGLIAQNPAVGDFAPFRMLAIKFVPVLCDSLICLLLYLMGRRKNEFLGIAVCALWAINPAAIFNCAFWGQTDCVLLLFVLAVFYLLQRGKHTACCVVYAFSLLLKFQAAYLAPVILFELVRSGGGFRSLKSWLSAAKNVGIAVGVWLIMWIPFMIGAKNALLPINVYLKGANTYPYINLNADNIYGIWGFNWKAETGIFAILTPAVLLALCALLLTGYLKLPKMHVFSASFLFVNGIFMLTTRQHERYQMLALLLLMLVYTELRDRRILCCFGAQALIVFSNEARILALVNHGGEWASSILTMQAINSLLNIAVCAFTAYVIMRHSIVPGLEKSSELSQ